MAQHDTPKPAERRPEPLLDGQGNVIETVKLTPEEEAARKRRAQFTGLALAAFIALIFLTTVLRMSSNYSSGG
jgi:hypothetical protein